MCAGKHDETSKLWHIFVMFAYVTHKQHCGRPVWVPRSMPLVPICISSFCPEPSLLSNVFACAVYTHKRLTQEHIQCWRFQLFKKLLSKVTNYAFEIKTGSDFALSICSSSWCQNKFCELSSCITQFTNKRTCLLWNYLITLYNKQRNGTKGGNGDRAIAPTRHS